MKIRQARKIRKSIRHGNRAYSPSQKRKAIWRIFVATRRRYVAKGWVSIATFQSSGLTAIANWSAQSNAELSA